MALCSIVLIFTVLLTFSSLKTGGDDLQHDQQNFPLHIPKHLSKDLPNDPAERRKHSVDIQSTHDAVDLDAAHPNHPQPQPQLPAQQQPQLQHSDPLQQQLLERIKQLEQRIAQLESSRLPSPVDDASKRAAPHGEMVSLSDRAYPRVRYLRNSQRKRILVTGGAGFVGSHLVDRLMLQGHEVIVVDNFYTGRKNNVRHWIGHPNFELIHHDIAVPLFIEVNEVYHLASPASPPHYMFNPIKTLKTNLLGTINMLGLAKRQNARFLFASTSEVYGDPEVHPQAESYWGHVNPIGPRSCYDEGKRGAEALIYAYMRHEKVAVRVARIFNTFGPRMHMEDGRVVSNFILQALRSAPITVYGDGNQTRSFMYVSDLVEGLEALMASNYSLPVNLGNPEEHSVQEFAEIIKTLTNSSSPIVYEAPHEDDPHRRRPDISVAARHIGWHPRVRMLAGLRKTIEYFRHELQHESSHEESTAARHMPDEIFLRGHLDKLYRNN